MMAERPILLFGEPATVAFGRKRGGGDKIQTPTYSEQVQRMAPKLEQLDKTLLSMQPSSEGIEPERTLVLEVAGDIESFYIAVKNMGDGVEWILDMPEQFEASDDFYVYDENKETKMRIRNDKKTDFRGKVYCVLTNAQALREMLTLWDRYSKDKNTPFPHGKAGLRDVFKHLIDIHIWGYKERLEETGILDYWQEELDSGDSSDIMCELEFFYRNSKEKREAQEQRIKNELEELGGSFVTSSIISHISYHAVLASIPRNEVKKIIEGNRSVSIVVADPIMFIRPVGQSVFIQKDNSFDATLIVPKPSDIIDEPIIALFDGVPQENHPYLTGRLVIDDPDDFTSHYTVQARKHGTSMASLIALGDLGNLVHQSLRKIYVRPIMKPTATLNDTIERIPDNELFVDKIHIAVRRLFEEEAGRIAPTIKVINLSIGLAYRQFDNTISPLARLIDWLSFTYRVLFVVSAGNHSGNSRGDDIDNVDIGMSLFDFAKLSMPGRDKKIVEYLDNNCRNLRLLSPAESVNALTVGATFEDTTGATCSQSASSVFPCSDGMLSPISALGKGLNNSIKPDIVYDGGRKFVTQPPIGAKTKVVWSGNATREPGTISAAPIEVASGSSKTMYTSGTSNSAALITHEAIRCHEALLEIFHLAETTVPDEHIALLIKAMLIHGAEWGKIGQKFCNTLGWNSRNQYHDRLHRFIGYGKPDIDRAIECAKNRVTLIGYGNLNIGDAHLFRLPLPFNFNTREIRRRLTATLTYFSPIVPSRQKYRAVDMWFALENGKENLLDDRVDASDKAVTRGSVQHEIFENEQIVVWDENDDICIKVNCRGYAAKKLEEKIPYAIMVSFELKSKTDIDVYTMVAEKVKSRVLAV